MTWLSLRSIIVYIQELFFLVAVAIHYSIQPGTSGNWLVHASNQRLCYQLQHSFQGKSFLTRLQMQVDSYYLSFITGFPVWTGQQAVVFPPSFKSIWIWRSVNTPPKIFDFLIPGKFYQPGTNVFDCVTWNKA